MRSGEPDPSQAGHFGGARQQGSEVPARRGWIAVTVHVLAQQLNLRVAFPGEPLRFLDDAPAGTAALRAAGERHHAIGAVLVAAFDDGDVGAMRIVAPCQRRFERLVSVQVQTGYPAIPRFDAHQQLRQLVVTRRAADHGDVRRLFENLVPSCCATHPRTAKILPFPAFRLNC